MRNAGKQGWREMLLASRRPGLALPRATGIFPAMVGVFLALAGVARGSLWYDYDGKDVEDPAGIVQRIVRPGDGWNAVHPDAFAGVMLDAGWADLEPGAEDYRFDKIDRTLASLAAKGLGGMVKLRDKQYQKSDANGSFANSRYSGCLPADLDGTGNITGTTTGPGGAFPIELGNDAWGRDETYRFIVQRPAGGGRLQHLYVAKRWNNTVQERWLKLVRASGASPGFGRHPNLRKLTCAETALPVSDPETLRRYFGYPPTTPATGYAEIIREAASTMRASFPPAVGVHYELGWIPAALKDGSLQRAVVQGDAGSAPGFRELRPMVGLLAEDLCDWRSYKIQIYPLFELYQTGEAPLAVQISGETRIEYHQGVWGAPGPGAFRNILDRADSIGGGNKVRDVVFKMHDQDFFEPLVTYLVSHTKDGVARKDGEPSGYGFLPRRDDRAVSSPNGR
jgi:hypothetical protein